jgi:hypothetical protein
VQGVLEGEKIRQSLDLTNWEAAQKRIREWEVHGIKNVMLLKDAYSRFIAQHEANGSAEATVGKHKRLMKRAVDFIGNVPLRSLTPDEVSRFREAWEAAHQGWAGPHKDEPCLLP